MSEQIETLCKQIASGEFQDLEDTEAASKSVGDAVVQSLQHPSDAVVLQVKKAFLRAMTFPEHKTSSFSPSTGISGIALSFARAQVADNQAELPLLLAVVLRAYMGEANERPTLRQMLGTGLSMNGASATLLKLCLEATRVVLELAPQTPHNAQAAKELLQTKLLPLHNIQGKISPTQSVLGSFHQELTLCVVRACERMNSSQGWEMVIVDLATTRYPPMNEGNSPKEVLFLHELEKVIAECTVPLTSKARSYMVTRLLSGISSLHAAVCQRALSFWRNEKVLKDLQGSDSLLSKSCEHTLAKTSLEHWSSTVKNMAGAALLLGNPTTAGSSESTSDGFVNQAVQRAQENSERLLNLQPVETMPMPKTFSSTSVLRDALEPFAIGAFGVIWKGRAIVQGVSKSQWPLVALKELSDLASAKQEAEAMSRIGSHPNLINLLGLYETRKGVAITLVLDYVDGPGDLHTVVVERGVLPVHACRFLAGEIGSGLRHIHSKGIVFGDMKPENVLITQDGHAKICDFGSAFEVQNSTSTVGTVEYMPPEQVSSVVGDWWAFGCTLHYMLCGRPPVFFDRQEDSDLSNAFSRAVTFADEKGGSLIQDNAGRMLVGQLCSRNPSDRPSDGGESHPFFKENQPWAGLHQRQGVAIPKEKMVKTATNSGPWQRRTFSTIFSPFPSTYVIDSAFLESCLGGLSHTDQEQHISFEDNRMSDIFDAAIALVPKSRISPPEEEDMAGSTNVSKKARHVPMPNRSYKVAGVDLSAG